MFAGIAFVGGAAGEREEEEEGLRELREEKTKAEKGEKKRKKSKKKQRKKKTTTARKGKTGKSRKTTKKRRKRKSHAERSSESEASSDGSSSSGSGSGSSSGRGGRSARKRPRTTVTGGKTAEEEQADMLALMRDAETAAEADEKTDAGANVEGTEQVPLGLPSFRAVERTRQPTRYERMQAEKAAKKPLPVGLYDPKKPRPPSPPQEVDTGGSKDSQEDDFWGLVNAAKSASSSSSSLALASQASRDDAPTESVPATAASGGAPADTTAPLSSDELSRLRAKALQAKLRGDSAAHDTLMAQLTAHKAASRPPPDLPGVPRPQAAPGRATQRSLPNEGSTRKQVVVVGQFGASRRGGEPAAGQGPDGSVQQLLLREMTDAEDMDAVFAQNILRLGKRYEGKEQMTSHGSQSGFDEEDQVDMQLYERVEDHRSAEKRAQIMRQRALNEHKRVTTALERCYLCPGSQRFPATRLVHATEHVLVLLQSPQHRLVEGQAILAPRAHVESWRRADETAWMDMRSALRVLRTVFAARGLPGVITFETAVKLDRCPHACMHVVPVSQEGEDDANIYFKQALAELEGTGRTIKLGVDHTRQRRRTLHSAVPEQFSYFCAEWGTDGDGVAFAMESDDRFPRDFATDTLSGMLDIDPLRVNLNRSRHGGRHQRETNEAEAGAFRQEAEAFKQLWNDTAASSSGGGGSDGSSGSSAGRGEIH